MDNPFSPQAAIRQERHGLLAGRGIPGGFSDWLRGFLRLIKLTEEERRSAGIHVGPLSEEERLDAGFYPGE